MKKKKLIFLAFATIAFALLLEAGILKYVNDRNTYRMSKVLLDRVIAVLNKNDDSETGLIESLKDDYIVRAKAVSYIIDAKPQVEYDVEELQKIAALISVDEIHLFDKNGYIYSGTLPKYYGYSFDSGEQMAYFKPMLSDQKLTTEYRRGQGTDVCHHMERSRYKNDPDRYRAQTPASRIKTE